MAKTGPETVHFSPFVKRLGDCSTCKLHSGSAFCSLPEQEFEALQQIHHPAHYAKGTWLFEEGDISPGVYIICSGHVKVSLSSHDGKAIVVRTLGPGELVGVVSTVSGGPCELGAETAEGCQLSFIEKKKFLRFIHQNEAARFRVVEHLSRKCNATRQMLGTLYLSGSAAAKLAKLLLRLSSQEPAASDVQLDLALTHDEIAERIDTARETVTRLMTALKRHNIVDAKGSKIYIRDKSALKAIANKHFDLRRSRARSGIELVPNTSRDDARLPEIDQGFTKPETDD